MSATGPLIRLVELAIPGIGRGHDTGASAWDRRALGPDALHASVIARVLPPPPSPTRVLPVRTVASPAIVAVWETLSGHAALVRPESLFGPTAKAADTRGWSADGDDPLPLPSLLADDDSTHHLLDRARADAHLFVNGSGSLRALTISCADGPSDKATLHVASTDSEFEGAPTTHRLIASLAPPPELSVVYSRGGAVILARRADAIDHELHIYQADDDGIISLKRIVSLGNHSMHLDFLDFSPISGRLLVLEQGVRSPTANLHCIDCGDSSVPSLFPSPIHRSRPLPILPTAIGNNESLIELSRTAPVLGPFRLKTFPHSVIIFAVTQAEWGYSREYPSAIYCIRDAESSGETDVTEGILSPVWRALVNFKVANMALDESSGLLIIHGATAPKELSALDVETGRDASVPELPDRLSLEDASAILADPSPAGGDDFMFEVLTRASARILKPPPAPRRRDQSSNPNSRLPQVLAVGLVQGSGAAVVLVEQPAGNGDSARRLFVVIIPAARVAAGDYADVAAVLAQPEASSLRHCKVVEVPTEMIASVCPRGQVTKNWFGGLWGTQDGYVFLAGRKSRRMLVIDCN
ncbi:hypothetical protein HK405_011089 [Cladochytrium tenue]|nr:hypothetical protein HK405_011089 [Cladochytrium tenue]